MRERPPTALRRDGTIRPCCLKDQRRVVNLQPLRLASRWRRLLVEVAHRVVARWYQPLGAGAPVEVRQTVEVMPDAPRRHRTATAVRRRQQVRAEPPHVVDSDGTQLPI